MTSPKMLRKTHLTARPALQIVNCSTWNATPSNSTIGGTAFPRLISNSVGAKVKVTCRTKIPDVWPKTLCGIHYDMKKTTLDTGAELTCGNCRRIADHTTGDDQ